MTESQKQKPGFYGWMNVVLLFIIYMSAMGFIFYGFSVIFPAMIKAQGWNRGTASIAQAIGVLLMGVAVPIVAVSINKLGAKKTISIGSVFLCVGLILLGTITSQLWQWIVIWGCIVSLGFAFCGILPIQTTLMYWFNIKRATAIGIVMTGAAVGGFLAQPFYIWLMGLFKSWQIGWLNGALFAFFALICSFFLINKPEDVGQHPDGLSPDDIKASQEGAGSRVRTYRTAKSWELKEVFRTPVIWFIAIAIIGHIMPIFLVTSHGVLHFTDKGFTQMQAASILSFMLLGSGFARFPAGWLGDRIEPRWILTVTLGIMIIMFIGIWKLSNLNLMMAAGMAFGFCYGSQLIMFPTIMGNYYGADIFAGINGVLGPLMILFAATVPVGAGYTFEMTGNYDLVFIALSIVLSIGFIASFLLSPPKEKAEISRN